MMSTIKDVDGETNNRSNELFEDRFGMTRIAPTNGGDAQAICFSVAICHLGCVAVAATSRGLCMIALGNERENLEKRVRDRFPSAALEETEVAFSAMVRQVVQLIGSPQRPWDLPLDIHGTAFQRKVWNALRRIPVGDTATYTEIAEAIGQPNASRAVARACATNPLAIAIPCHRVVRKDGSLSGYRWGIERKRQLLEEERQHTEQCDPPAQRALL